MSGPGSGYLYPSFSIRNCVMQGTSLMGAMNTVTGDPRFTNPAGADGVIGTADDDYSLRLGSPAIDAGDSTLLPAGITMDLAGHARFFDAPGVANTGTGVPNYLDIGALEFMGTGVCRGDFNGSGRLDVQDIFDFVSAWLAGDVRADFNGTGGITVQDVFDFLNVWLSGC
jgi:hypothetical protein